MTPLEQSLQKHDLGHLRIVAQLWGIELHAGERKAARIELSEKLLDPVLTAEVTEALPSETRRALDSLSQNQGRILWVAFTREFGEIREFGAGKRDREKLYLSPISAAETLFYRALLARAFFDTPSGAQEFAYIPEDIFAIIHKSDKGSTPTQELGRLARPEERAHIIFANDHILDDLTTSLAAKRLGWDKAPLPLETSPRFIHDLGLAARLILPSPFGGGAGGGGGGIQTDAVKAHLEQDRAKALAQLRKVWRKSEKFNELRQMPTIICEGEWTNPILDTREAIFGFLAQVPRGKWWSLKAFISDIKEKHPDFQRKAGEYDAWFIRRAEDGAPLRGFEHWDEVEGALIRYFITKVLHCLGIVDVGFTKKNGEVTAFRITNKALSKPQEEKIIVTSSGQITISRFAPRVARYQISRFGEWEENKNSDEYKYQITPFSLERAKTQGLKISHLLGLLKKFADPKTPPTLERALRRWEISGTEARVETLSVLRLSKPEDLRKLRESKAGRFLGEVLSPTRVVVKAGASQKIMSALIEMGIFMKDEK